MEPQPKPIVRRWADWFERQWGALSELGRTAVVLGLLLAAALGVVAAWTDWVKDVKGAPLLVATAMPEKTAGVAAAAWLDPRGEGPEVRLWVLFRNDSGVDVADLRYLKLDTPGFRWVACMASGGPDCRPQGRGKHPVEGLPAVLHPGESRAVFGRLAPTGRASHGVSGIFGWRDAAGQHAGLLVVPEAPADRAWQRSLDFAGRLVLFLRDLVKDLAWPVVLALLAWYLKRRDDRREAEEKRAEKAREARELEEKHRREEMEQQERARREERERLQARIQETWNLMLPKSHAYAERHYMPVLGRAIVFYELVLAEAKPDAKHLMWALLRLVRGMQDLVKAIAGFYFRDLDAEDLAARCWKQFRQRAEERLGRPDLYAAANVLARDETLDVFLQRTAPPASDAAGDGTVATVLARLEANLRLWYEGTLPDAVPYLQLLSFILEYEVNRTYELWYRRPAGFNSAKFGEVLERLRAGAAPEDQSLQELVRDLEKYPERVAAHQRSVDRILEGATDSL